MNTSNRLLYLDNLKVCLTVLVIFHHAGQAYGDGGGWAYHPSNPAEFMPWIWHFFSVNAAFFMGLFFLISGYFVPTSFDKQGAKVFVQKKLIRLGIPLLLMGGLIAALSDKPEIGHMWYIESLLVFCLIYALIRLICKPIDGECSSRPTIIGLLIFGGVMGLGSYLIRLVSPGSLDMAFRHHPLANGTGSLSAIRDDVCRRHSGQSLSLVSQDEQYHWSPVAFDRMLVSIRHLFARWR